MFNETYSDNNITLTFIKSTNIQAYPCGRRRSNLVDKDGSDTTTNDQYYFPFDPEARLNTEANNRKHSSLNGYTQTYLQDWDSSNKVLSLAVAGYLFNITLDDYIVDPDTDQPVYNLDAFGNAIITALLTNADATESQATSIYVNILLEDVKLFTGFQEYYTSILRNQSNNNKAPETSLDLLNEKSRNNLEKAKNFDNYYFSGLSFSTTPVLFA